MTNLTKNDGKIVTSLIFIFLFFIIFTIILYSFYVNSLTNVNIEIKIIKDSYSSRVSYIDNIYRNVIKSKTFEKTN